MQLIAVTGTGNQQDWTAESLWLVEKGGGRLVRTSLSCSLNQKYDEPRWLR